MAPPISASEPIPFHRPTRTGNEDRHVLAAMDGRWMAGDGAYSKRCQAWFEQQMPGSRCLMTPSCTHALELAADLINLSPGDEVIMPSFTFVSTANAVARRGAIPVFVDICQDTLNLDPQLVKEAITKRTRAIMPVHYAGAACDMAPLLSLALQHGLLIIEDAAQGVGSAWNGKPLGTIGALGALSFHETKNITSGGEGGLLIINQPEMLERAEILREKGTNRARFFRGEIDRYTWLDLGSSGLPGELQAAYLWGQLEAFDTIRSDRLRSWHGYYQRLAPLVGRFDITLPTIHLPEEYNGHLFVLRCRDLQQRSWVLTSLRNQGVQATFHYVPLHSAPAGQRWARFHGEDRWTTLESERLIRLPLWYGMDDGILDRVATAVESALLSSPTDAHG